MSIRPRIALGRAGLGHALGPARQDDAGRLARANRLERRVRRPHFRVDRQLAQSPGDELRVLRTEIQHEDGLMGHGRNHYYNGVTAAWTTRCCSALALIGCCGIAPIDAQPKSDRGPLLLFPTRPVWTLALNNQIDGASCLRCHARVFSIDGDRRRLLRALVGNAALDREPAADAGAGRRRRTRVHRR